MELWDRLNREIESCRKCERLTAWREHVANTRRRAYIDQAYWGKPVIGFGDPAAKILVVGLAPGAHGSNRTGRMFTGDSSGDFLYRALYKAGFASQPVSKYRDDELQLKDVFISAVCRCAPPDNRPTPQEISTCLPYLDSEWDLLSGLEGVVALGRIAFENSQRLLRQRGVFIPRLKFEHAKLYSTGADAPWLIASYHPSRQNTQTGRLTEAMFDRVWEIAKEQSGQ